MLANTVDNTSMEHSNKLKDETKKNPESINGSKICESHCNFVLKKYTFEKKFRSKEGINPVGICGNQCGCNCALFLQGCDGCRSDNFNCSFASLFVDKKCPNVTCANERNLEGCYECDKLKNCKIRFYGINVYFGKASALFIKKHGMECFMNTLKKAVNTGEKFIKGFFNNGAGSVDFTLSLLEKYI